MNRLMSSFVLLTLFVLAAESQAYNNYYPQNFIKSFEQGEINNLELKQLLFRVLSATHQKNNSGHDTLGCHDKVSGNCYSHQSLGYRGARKVLFGKLHLEQDNRGAYIRDVYCHKEIRNTDTNIGSNTIPDNTIINCEHTWPQSRFTKRFSKRLQKSDLHHLFPTDSSANSVRGNYDFDELSDYKKPVKNCVGSYTEGRGQRRFQPPAEHRGNVARAMFYFSTRYQVPIKKIQEKLFRKWHLEDPIDQAERVRNEFIFKVQKNRNPFIDLPQLVLAINDF